MGSTFSWSPRAKTRLLLGEALRAFEVWRPRTVRNVYYHLVGQNMVENDPGGQGYRAVMEMMLNARKAGIVPWDWISEGGRSLHELESFESLIGFRLTAPDWYHARGWIDQPQYFELWVEKIGLIDVLLDICHEYRVGLHATVGDDSWTAIRKYIDRSPERRDESANESRMIFHLADFDPQGWQMTQDLEDRLLFFNCLALVERIGINPEQAENLPKNAKSYRPKKKNDFTGRRFQEEYGLGAEVELDAMEVPELRQLVVSTFEEHLDMDVLKQIKKQERDEQDELRRLIWGDDYERWSAIEKALQ